MDGRSKIEPFTPIYTVSLSWCEEKLLKRHWKSAEFVAHVCNTSTLKPEAGILWIWGQLELYSETLSQNPANQPTNYSLTNQRITEQVDKGPAHFRGKGLSIFPPT